MSENVMDEKGLIRLKDLRKAYRTPAGEFYALRASSWTSGPGSSWRSSVSLALGNQPLST